MIMKKDNINKNQLAKETAKFLSGEMDAAESVAFKKEIEHSEEYKTDFEADEYLWNAMTTMKEQRSPDKMKAWDRVYHRISEERLVPETDIPQTKYFVPVFVRYAALILVLAGIFTIIYTLSVTQKPAVEMVRLDTQNETNTLIKTLTDGSVVYLAQNTVFSYPKEFEADSRKVELTGEAFFDITPNPDKPFVITTEEAIIQVLGTAFNVRTKNGDHFELVVNRGKVKVSLKNDPSKTELVQAGEKLVINNGLIRSVVSSGDMPRWYLQRMQFKDESLQNILNVLNRNFNTKFAVSNQETGNRKLTVTFSDETPETMSELICQALNLQSQTKDDSIILSEGKDTSKGN